MDSIEELSSTYKAKKKVLTFDELKSIQFSLINSEKMPDKWKAFDTFSLCDKCGGTLQRHYNPSKEYYEDRCKNRSCGNVIQGKTHFSDPPHKVNYEYLKARIEWCFAEFGNEVAQQNLLR